MKYFFFNVALLIFTYQALAQDSRYLFEKIPSNLSSLAELKVVNNEPSIFIADISQLREMIEKSNKKYKVVYFFSPTCHSSKGTFPMITKYIQDNSDQFDLFVISGLRYNKVQRIANYLSDIGYFKPVFVIDTEKHGNKAESFSRLDQLTIEMCPKCIVKKMGFSDFFVIAEKNEVANTNFLVYTTDIERFEILRSLPLD